MASEQENVLRNNELESKHKIAQCLSLSLYLYLSLYHCDMAGMQSTVCHKTFTSMLIHVVCFSRQ